MKRYPVKCAWCEKEGWVTVLYWSTVKGSHGICQYHQSEMKAEVAQLCSEPTTPSPVPTADRRDSEKRDEYKDADSTAEHWGRRAFLKTEKAVLKNFRQRE